MKRFSRGDLDEVGHYRYVLKNKGIDIIYNIIGPYLRDVYMVK